MKVKMADENFNDVTVVFVSIIIHDLKTNIDLRIAYNNNNIIFFQYLYSNNNIINYNKLTNKDHIKTNNCKNIKIKKNNNMMSKFSSTTTYNIKNNYANFIGINKRTTISKASLLVSSSSSPSSLITSKRSTKRFEFKNIKTFLYHLRHRKAFRRKSLLLIENFHTLNINFKTNLFIYFITHISYNENVLETVSKEPIKMIQNKYQKLPLNDDDNIVAATDKYEQEDQVSILNIIVNVDIRSSIELFLYLADFVISCFLNAVQNHITASFIIVIFMEQGRLSRNLNAPMQSRFIMETYLSS